MLNTGAYAADRRFAIEQKTFALYWPSFAVMTHCLLQVPTQDTMHAHTADTLSQAIETVTIDPGKPASIEHLIGVAALAFCSALSSAKAGPYRCEE
jgi:hypothetical protein